MNPYFWFAPTTVESWRAIGSPSKTQLPSSTTNTSLWSWLCGGVSKPAGKRTTCT